MNNDRRGAFLSHHGWREISSGHGQFGNVRYWDHRQHQPDRRGAFTTLDAEKHQREFMKNGACDCIKEEIGNR